MARAQGDIMDTLSFCIGAFVGLVVGVIVMVIAYVIIIIKAFEEWD